MIEQFYLVRRCDLKRYYHTESDYTWSKGYKEWFNIPRNQRTGASPSDAVKCITQDTRWWSVFLLLTHMTGWTIKQHCGKI